MDNNQRLMASIDQRIKFVFPHAHFELLPLPGPPFVRYDARLMIKNEMGAAEVFVVHRVIDLSHHEHPDGPIAGYTQDFVAEMIEKMLGYLIGRLHRCGGYDQSTGSKGEADELYRQLRSEVDTLLRTCARLTVERDAYDQRRREANTSCEMWRQRAQALGYGKAAFSPSTKWIQLKRTSPSGKTLFACRYCGLNSPTPDKSCASTGQGMPECEEK